MSPILLAASAFLFALLHALAAAAEWALLSASVEAVKGSGASPRALESFTSLKSRPEATFAAVRAALVFSLSLSATLGAAAGALWLGPWSSAHAPHLGSLVGLIAGGLLTAAIATAFDVAARALADANPPRAAARAAAPVLLLSRLLQLPLSLAARTIDLLVRPWGGRASFGPPRPALEDLQRLLVEEAGREGIDPQGPGLIKNIFAMSERTARDVMIPRARVLSLELSTPPREILETLAEHGHSRMPVYQGDIDHVVGVLHARDLASMLANPELIVVHDLLRPAHFIPWSKPVGELLREMQRLKIHMALVVDEYGGVVGLVTLEDVLEVIVGEIGDEFDQEVTDIDPASDGSFLVLASVPLETFRQTFPIELPEGDFETLAGFLNHLAGCIPEVGDKFFYGGLQFTVQDRAPRQVRRVRVQRLASTPSGDRPKRRELSGR